MEQSHIIMPKRQIKKPKQKKQKPQQPVKKQRVQKQKMTSPMLSDCARKYSLACSNPWHPGAAGACVPKFPARPSQKIKMYNRFTMDTVGSDIYLFVMPTLANDVPFALWSNQVGKFLADGAFFNPTTPPGVFMTDALVSAGIWNIVTVNSPYTSAVFAYGAGRPLQVSGRIVSTGISYEASSNVNNLGGVTYMMPSPAHDDVSQIPPANLGQLDECVKRRLTNKKQWTVIAAMDDAETAYTAMQPFNQQFGFATEYADLYPFSNNYAGPIFQPLGTVSALTPSVSTATVTMPILPKSTYAYLTVVTGGTCTNLVLGSTLKLAGSTVGVLLGDSAMSKATASAQSGVLVAGQTLIVYNNTGADIAAVSTAAALSSTSTNSKYTTPIGCPVTMLRYVPGAQLASTSYPSTLECEVIAHAEFVGSLTAALHSPSHADIVGMQSVIAANARVPQLQTAFPDASIDNLHSIALREATSNNSFVGGLASGFRNMGITPHTMGEVAGGMLGSAAYAALRGSIGTSNGRSVRRMLTG